MTGATARSRPLWTLFEPVHALVYFAPEARAAFEDAGLRGFWRGYFAGRAAPLGPVGAAPVVASFFGFAPAMVARALPDVWTRASPEQALTARVDGAVAALRRLLADGAAGARAAVNDGAASPGAAANDSAAFPGATGPDGGPIGADGAPTWAVEEVADLLERAIDGLDCAGRVLGAANAALPRPGEPLARIWHACTVLREHRGDGHVAALVAAGLTGRDVMVLRAAIDVPREALQPARGWTDAEWTDTAADLAARHWLGPDGAPTDAGRARFAEIEAATDRAAAAPWRRLGTEQTDRLAELLRPIARASAAGLPFPNPIGLPALA